MTPLFVYSTAGCHLCELALEVIVPLVGNRCTIQQVDISEDDELIERYGVRIPVIRRLDDDTELDWPFDIRQFLAFIA
jgi:hypothetical protein